MSPLAANNILFPVLDRRRYLPLDIACSDSSLGRQVSVNPKTVFFATANLGAEYSGTESIDRALLDRFQPVEVDYPTAFVESQVLVKRTNVAKKTADRIVSIANSIRKEAKKDELSTSISVRHTLDIANLIQDGFDERTAAMQIITPLFSVDGSGDANERNKVVSIIGAF